MKIDDNIKQYGNENNVPITKDDTLFLICNIINQYKCKDVLEIGTAIGYGCITIAQNCNVSHIDSLEIDKDRYDIAVQNITKHKLQNTISLYNIDAMDYLKTTKKKYDFVYLDGPKGQYVNYLPYIINILKSGGILVADNLYFHGMVTGRIPITKGCRAMIKGLKNYIQAIKTTPELETTIYDIGDGVGVSIKK